MPHVSGLHHVTILSSSAVGSDRLFRDVLGLTRVKRTVNPDRPDSYHLFYGDAAGRPGTLVTVHPFANLPQGMIGVGEIAEPAFAVTPGAPQEWIPHLRGAGFAVEPPVRAFDRNRIVFDGPGGERLALQVEPRDGRDAQPKPFGGRAGLRGLHSVLVRVRDGDAVGAMLERLGFQPLATEENVTRYSVGAGAAGGGLVDVASVPDGPAAVQGAGSVHHLAFSVPGRSELDDVLRTLRESGHEATEVAERTGFESFFFRGPEGLLFEVATATANLREPGAADDDLELPPELEGDRAAIEARLEPLDPM